MLCMSFLTHLECPECERDFPADVVQNLCPCGAPLFARYELGFMIYGFGFFFVMPLLADHCARDLGLGYAVFGYAAAIQQVVQALVVPVLGTLWDRIGTARTAQWSFLLLAPFALAMVFVERPWEVYCAFALFGLAMSGVHVVWNLGSVEFAGREDSSRFMTVHATCVGVRALIAPALAYAIQAWRGHDARYAFLAATAFFLVSVAVMRRLERAVAADDPGGLAGSPPPRAPP